MGGLTIFWGSAWTITTRNPVGNVLVPFIFRLAFQQGNHDHGHIITADAASLAIRGQAIIHHVFADLGELLLGGNTSSNEFNNSLRRLAVPDACFVLARSRTGQGWRRTIACDNEKFIVVRDGMSYNIWKSSHDLLFW